MRKYLGNELLAIFDVTRDKMPRAARVLKSVRKLDPSVSEEADEASTGGAKRRSRRQRAANLRLSADVVLLKG